MACTYSDIIAKLVWQLFLVYVEEWIEKKAGPKLAKRFRNAALKAGADGFLPIGDIAALWDIVHGVLESVFDIIYLRRFYSRLILKFDRAIEAMKNKIAQRIDDPDFLDDPCKCECFKDYLSDLIKLIKKSKAARKKGKRRARKKFDKCIHDC